MKTFKELFVGTGIEPTTDENGGVHYNFNATLKKEPMKEIESNCLYCDINFIAIEHKSGECPNCKEKYEWDYDGDYGVDSVYGIQWLSTYPINKNKKTMKKQYVLIDRLKIVAIEEAAVEKALNNKERPLSEASIEARAVLQVIHTLYQLNETKSDLELQNQ